MAAVVVLVALHGIFLMIRKSHYTLLKEAADHGAQKDGWEIYPRPQLRRDGFLLLNKGWSCNGKDIRVPFPPQSVLAEYDGNVGSKLTYETTFTVPQSLAKERFLLHFGAVDQVAEVWLNDTCVGRHEGGYLGFSFDVSNCVKREGENKLVVRVTDTLSKKYPYGKQCKKRGGMWYTPVSGSWQSV